LNIYKYIKSILAAIIFMTIPVNILSAEIVEYHGYRDCIKIENKTTRLILGPACGGRILEYSVNGENVLYLDEKQSGWTYLPGNKLINPSAGRFDVGPANSLPKHLWLWVGKWKAEITGKFSACMISVKSPTLGIQLIRNFVLNPVSSKLTITQTIKNISNKTVTCNHWSRTLAISGGICIIPLTPHSRYPGKYVIYQDNLLNIKPEDKNVIINDDIAFVKNCPSYPKLGFDSYSGWLAYLSPNNLLFIKSFSVYPERVYSEASAMTVCVYYNRKFCELEPIGPRENLKPGESASFTETWRLEKYQFPENIDSIDTNNLMKKIKYPHAEGMTKMTKAAFFMTGSLHRCSMRIGNC
jgi:hypothetical protein